MKNKNLCLIGCGWLGKPLAKTLLSKGHTLTVTTASDKSPEFQSEGISYITFDLIQDPFNEEILKADIVVYTIPPLPFVAVKNFFDHLPTDKKIIFTSSTSVYGKNMGSVDEDTPIDPENTQSPLLAQTEEYLRARFKNAVILRLGGLYGEKRHPVYFLAGKKDIKTGGEFLHLAHQDDCVSAITKIIETETWGQTLNIISDLRITKRDYYLDMAQKLSLPLPEYAESDKGLKETKISNQKSKTLLQIHYKNPSEFYKSSE